MIIHDQEVHLLISRAHILLNQLNHCYLKWINGKILENSRWGDPRGGPGGTIFGGMVD